MKQLLQPYTAKDGTQLMAARSGAGFPLVRVWPGLSHLNLEWDNPVWGRLLTWLSSFRTLWRYDERGCGLSDWTAGKFGLDSWVSDLEDLLDGMSIPRCDLFGYSVGGAIAIAFAAKYPQRVRKLVLLNTSLASQAILSKEFMDSLPIQQMLVTAAWTAKNPRSRRMYATDYLRHPTQREQAWLDDYQRFATSSVNAEQHIEAFANVDVRDLAPRIKCPTMVLHSEGNQRVALARGIEVAQSIPGAEFRVLESPNHIMKGSDPAWQAFTTITKDFLGSEDTYPTEKVTCLSQRELEVLSGWAAGRRANEIANRLDISAHTVRNHIASVYEKIGIRTKFEATQFWQQVNNERATTR